MTDPVRTLVARLDAMGFDPRSTGPDSWDSRCSGHDGSRHNLSVARGEDGRALLHCHKGCDRRAVLAPLGMTEADLFPARTGSAVRPDAQVKPKSRRVHPSPGAVIAAVVAKLGETTAWCPYYSADGREVARVYRFDPPGAKKEYRPVHATEGGWAIGDPPGLWPLYRLPELSGADLVFICEGERCADAVRGLGWAATTTAHGAKSPHKTDLSPLAGKRLVILPDHDEAGEAYAAALVACSRSWTRGRR